MNQDVPALNKRAKKLLKSGRSQEAIALCQQSLKLDPHCRETYEILGDGFSKLGKSRSAKRVYKTLENLDRPSAEIEFKRGNDCVQLKQWDEAIAHYRRAIEIAPSSPQIYEKLAIALSHRHRFSEAIACIETQINLQPYSATAYQNLGILLELENNLEAAIVAYLNSYQIDPKDSSIFIKLVNSFALNGQLERAISFAEIGLKKHPGLTQKYFKLDNISYDRHRLAIGNNLIEKIVYSSREWARGDRVASPQENRAIACREVYPSSAISLPSQTLSGTSPPGFIVSVREGQVWGDSANTIVVAGGDRLLADVCTGGGKVAWIFGLKMAYSVCKLPGMTACLSVQAGRDYYHWMVDVLPRIELLELGGFELDKIDRFLVNPVQYKYQQETLSILGIPRQKWHEIEGDLFIQAETLIVPSVPTTAPKWMGEFIDGPPRWVCEFLRDRFLPKEEGAIAVSPTPNKIYINRQQAKHRRVVNELEAIEFLKNYGFVSVSLERLSFREQVRLLSGAQVVVAPHGAGLTNAVFCQPGTVVIELFSHRYRSSCYQVMSHHLGLEYRAVVGKDYRSLAVSDFLERNPNLLPYSIYEDIYIDLEQLAEYL
jgi:capsular polysaccharide biosynthesis protein/Flp pilus assembly protein TadD